MASRHALVLCGLLLCAGQVAGQDIKLGDKLSAEQLATLQKQATSLNQQIAQAQSRSFRMEVGDYLTIEPPETMKGPFLFLVTNEDLATMITVDAGSPFITYLRHAGDAKPELKKWAAKTASWFLVVGTKEGTTTITVIVNGQSGQPPFVLDKLEIVIGKPKPPPPPPDADPLLKLAAADMAAGKGTQDDVDFYRNYLLTVANSLPATVQYATSKDFWIAFRAGMEGTIKDRLPSMRKAIGEQLNKDVPEKEGDAFDAARRNLVATALRTIAARLETK